MDRESFEGTIERFRARRPFHPFTVTLVSGEKVEIDRPETLVYREGLAVFIGPGRIPWVFDHEGVSHIVGDLINVPRSE